MGEPSRQMKFRHLRLKRLRLSSCAPAPKIQSKNSGDKAAAEPASQRPGRPIGISGVRPASPTLRGDNRDADHQPCASRGRCCKPASGPEVSTVLLDAHPRHPGRFAARPCRSMAGPRHRGARRRTGGRRSRRAAGRRDHALHLQQPDPLGRRTGVDPVPVARQPRRGRRAAPRHAHAHHGAGVALEPAGQAWAEALAIAAPCLMLAILIGPMTEYAADEWVVQTPALSWPNTVRAAAVPVGAALMIAHRTAAPGAPGHRRPHRRGPRDRGAGRRAVPRLGLAAGHRQLEPRHLLRAAAGHRRAARRADRVLLRPGDGGLPAVRHLDAARGGQRPHRRRHEFADPAGGAAVHPARAPGRDDRHGQGDGGLPGLAAGPCARRPELRAAGRDAAGVRHLRRQDGRHGRRRPGAAAGDEEARQRRRRTDLAAGRLRRDGRDGSALAGADHHRLGRRHLDRRRCSPAACCRASCWR